MIHFFCRNFKIFLKFSAHIGSMHKSTRAFLCIQEIDLLLSSFKLNTTC